MSMTNYLEDQILAHIFRSGSFVKPTSLTVHLYTSAPSDVGTDGTEVTGGSYAPVTRAPSDANWAASSGGNGTTSNIADLVFPAPTANWGTITAWAVKDQGGNMLFRCTMVSPKTVNSGDPAPKFLAGALQVVFD